MLAVATSLVCLAGIALANPLRVADPTAPHLAQAWIAESTGDGEPDAIGKESYLYEDCPKGESDDCLQGHIFDYGTSCKKLEINAGFKSDNSGTYLINCDAVDCCYEGDQQGDPADVKQWDIYHSNGRWNPTHPVVSYLGKQRTTELYNKSVVADAWRETIHLPFAKKATINYTYYVTVNSSDVISHRIDFQSPAVDGSILYGNFQVQHDIAQFRKTFVVPPECQHNNILSCNTGTVERLAKKFHPHTLVKH